MSGDGDGVKSRKTNAERTELRMKVGDKGIKRIIARLGPQTLPDDLIPPVTRLDLRLPNEITFAMRGHGGGIPEEPSRLLDGAHLFLWDTPSGGEIKVQKKGRNRWLVVYRGPTVLDRDESGLFQILCRDLMPFSQEHYQPRIKPRSELARARMRELGFREINEDGKPVVHTEG